MEQSALISSSPSPLASNRTARAIGNANRCSSTTRDGILDLRQARPSFNDCESTDHPVLIGQSVLTSSSPSPLASKSIAQVFGGAGRCSVAMRNEVRAFPDTRAPLQDCELTNPSICVKEGVLTCACPRLQSSVGPAQEVVGACRCTLGISFEMHSSPKARTVVRGCDTVDGPI